MNKQLAFIFPGQGSQAVGMLRELAEQYNVIEATFASASEALGYDLWKLAQTGPAEQLNQTEYTQPALLAASVALWQVWKEQGGDMPYIMAGHSLGEYSALVCAQALDFKTAIQLVAKRGHFMQAAVPEGQGAMAAIIGLDVEKVREICTAAAQGEILAPANFNAIGQVVIAGDHAAVERAMVLAKEIGASMVVRLAVSAPSHCNLMLPAAERLAAEFTHLTLQKPQVSVLSNADVSLHYESTSIKDALIRQLYSPVRWVEIIQHMAAQGIKTMVECGPGKVLAGLNKRIDSTIQTFARTSNLQ